MFKKQVYQLVNHKYTCKKEDEENFTFFNITIIVVWLMLICVVGSRSFPDVVEKVFSRCGVGCTGHIGTVLVMVVVMVVVKVMMRI
jgi:hypothetical protein